jgi:hypothetical protein
VSQPSLLQFILNQEGSSVYGDNKNYDINDITIESALKMVAIKEFDNQAYVDNGIGFKAFILAYDNKGINFAMAQKPEGGSISEETGGILGGLTKLFKKQNRSDSSRVDMSDLKQAAAEAEAEQNPVLQALGQLNFLNDVRAKVWIPTLDKDVPNPQIIMGGPPLVDAVVLENRDLYQTCAIEKESLLSSLPPPGSLVVVDYENRKTRSGLTMKHTICTDLNFARIIMGEFAGIADEKSLEALYSQLANTSAAFGFPNGDSIGQLLPVTPALTPDDILVLAANYDSDNSENGPIPNKSQHLSHLNNAHYEFEPYMKAFMFKAWDEKKITITLNSSYRSPSKQAQLRADWVSGGKIGPEPTGGTSYHNFGMAMDFNPTLENGKTIRSKDSSHAWAASGIVEIGESVNLYWGGRFSTNWDPIHFDFRNVVSPSTMKNKLLDLSIAQGVTANRVNYSAVV